MYFCIKVKSNAKFLQINEIMACHVTIMIFFNYFDSLEFCLKCWGLYSTLHCQNNLKFLSCG